MNTFIPDKINPDMFPHRDREKYLYVIGSITERSLLNEKTTPSKANDKRVYVPLSSEYLAKVLGSKSYKHVMRELRETEVIECDNVCIPPAIANLRGYARSKSLGYRLNEYFAQCHTKPYKYTNPKLINKINSLYEDFSKSYDIIHRDQPEYSKLKADLQRVELNSKGATDYIQNNFTGDSDKPHKADKNLIAVNKMANREYYIKDDRISGRVHSNITSFSKELRTFLSVKGERLVNIDIANSQPFLFNILIKDFIKEQFEQEYYILNSIQGNPLDLYNSKIPYNDVKLFELLTSQGKFYEFIMNEINYTGDRGEFKKQFFGTVFFSDEDYYPQRKIFNKVFPTCGKAIDHYKRNDYTYLPITLQRKERQLIINNVCRQIALEKPQAFITTIHDSILTTKDNQNYVKDIMYKAFENEFNLQPKINTEQY